VGVVYRPNSAKVKNLKTKDYLGKARLVAATSRSNAFTGFSGAELKKVCPKGSDGGCCVRNCYLFLTTIPKQSEAAAAQLTQGRDDRPPDSISFAASNLVKPDLRSRSRLQSEPPLNRQVFPPTPPPESDKTSPSRRGSEQERPMSLTRSATTGGADTDRLLATRLLDVGSPEAEKGFMPGGAATTAINNNNNNNNNNNKPPDPAQTASALPYRPAAAAGAASPPPKEQPERSTPQLRSDAENGLVSPKTLNERAASMRVGKSFSAGRPDGRGGSVSSGVRERPRLPTIRTASEPRDGPSRHRFSPPTVSSAVEGGGFSGFGDYAWPRAASRERPRRRLDAPDEEAEDEYTADLLDFYPPYRRKKSFARRNGSLSRAAAHAYIHEADELDGGGGSDDAEGDVFVNENDFEMLSGTPGGGGARRRHRPSSRRPEVRKVCCATLS
jgi:hypothetical protein